MAKNSRSHGFQASAHSGQGRRILGRPESRNWRDLCLTSRAQPPHSSVESHTRLKMASRPKKQACHGADSTQTKLAMPPGEGVTPGLGSFQIGQAAGEGSACKGSLAARGWLLIILGGTHDLT